jgi:hypothetical protein
LHSSERLPIADEDDSPASTPGPATPLAGEPVPTPAAAKRSDLTTEMLDLILGKSDSITMKEKMAFALEESNSVDERVEALDDFEMVSTLPYEGKDCKAKRMCETELADVSSSSSS